jgi:HK97 family phage major capsid protein
MTKTTEQLVGELANEVRSYKEAQDKLLVTFAEKGKLDEAEKAVKQLETQFAGIGADIEARMAKIKRLSWDSRGNYRGVFESEDQARGFGLLCMTKARGYDPESDVLAKGAEEVLKRDYPDIHKRAMDSVGDGALIPPEFSTRLVRLVESFGVFEANAFIMPMASESLSFMRRTGGLSVFLVGENAAGTTSDPAFGNVSLTAKEWGTLTYVPRTLDEDSAAEIGELIAFEIAQAFAEKTDEIGFNGDGTSTYFGVVGVRERLKGLSATIANIAGLVVGAGNEYSELVLNDFEKVMGTLPQYAANNAKWYVSRFFFFSVMVKLMHAVGGVTAGEIEGRRRLLFGGDPVEIAQAMPRAQANSQVCALYGDLRRAATVGRRRGVTIETSRDYKFAERQITFLGTRRIAINVHDVGNHSATASLRVPGPIVGLITAAS